jgi:hypothetical protein
MTIMLNAYELSVARRIKSLPDFKYRIGLVFIDTNSGQQKRVTLTDTVWVKHIRERLDLVPDLSDSFLVGMLQSMLGWPEIQTAPDSVMVGHPQNKVTNKNPTIARAIGLYKLAKQKEAKNVVSL